MFFSSFELFVLIDDIMTLRLIRLLNRSTPLSLRHTEIQNEQNIKQDSQLQNRDFDFFFFKKKKKETSPPNKI